MEAPAASATAAKLPIKAAVSGGAAAAAPVGAKLPIKAAVGGAAAAVPAAAKLPIKAAVGGGAAAPEDDGWWIQRRRGCTPAPSPANATGGAAEDGRQSAISLLTATSAETGGNWGDMAYEEEEAAEAAEAAAKAAAAKAAATKRK